MALKQEGPWTYGILANQIWSFAGQDDRENVSSTFLEPFLSYTTHDAWTFSLDTESTYNWEARDWAVPINVTISKLVRIDKQAVSFGIGTRYWAASPDGGPDGFGIRAFATLLFPE